MHPVIKDIEKKYFKKSKLPDFKPGDTLRVAIKVKEADKERIQNFEGVVIARHGGGLRETFTVRRVSFGIGVERTFLIHSPVVEKLTIIRRGKVRRAKLLYLRERGEKKARIKELITEQSMKKNDSDLVKNEIEQEPNESTETK